MRFYQASCDCGWVGKRVSSEGVAGRGLKRHLCDAPRPSRVTAHVISESDQHLVAIAHRVTNDWMGKCGGQDDRDEVLSDAFLGVAQALKTWKPDGGTVIGSHAYWRARGAVLDGYRDKRAPVRRSQYSKGVRYEDLPQPQRYPVSIDALAELDVPHLVVDLRQADHFVQVETDADLADLLSTLPDRLRQVVVLIDLLGFTQVEVAQALDVTGSRVCQMRKDALRRLRASASGPVVPPPSREKR